MTIDRSVLLDHPTERMTPESVVRGAEWVIYVYGGQYARDLAAPAGIERTVRRG